MELTFIRYFGETGMKGLTKITKGTKVTVDKIAFDPQFASGVKVRVVSLWKKPTYLDLGWFVKNPKLDY